eukprot:GCRY01006264.1.p1 GENE.GCRY01006264.1~~GCRY01006264.1.p1  ORF type:complete len:309 (+),score=71.83 GCRY01006264.1:241-1167(+)
MFGCKDEETLTRKGYFQDRMDKYNAEERGMKKGSLFKGISIYINGYVEPNPNVLRELVAAEGGHVEHWFSKKKVTHIIANNLTSKQEEDLKGFPTVTPKWITDSLSQGKLLDPRPYSVLSTSLPNQPTLAALLDPSHARPKLRSSAASFFHQESSHTHSAQPEPTVSDRKREKKAGAVPFSSSKMKVKRSTSAVSGSGVMLKKEGEDETRTDTEENAEELMLSEDEDGEERGRGAGNEPRRVLDTMHPDFISSYYSSSRLHYLSSMKNELKEKLTDLILRTNGNRKSTGAKQVKSNERRSAVLYSLGR